MWFSGFRAKEVSVLVALLLTACGSSNDTHQGSEAPPPLVITSTSAVSLSENSVLSHRVSANRDATFQLASSSDSQWFELDSETGLLISQAELDYEDPVDENQDNVYEVSIIAQDSSGLSTTQRLNIAVSNQVELGLKVAFPSPMSVTGVIRDQLHVRGFLVREDQNDVIDDISYRVTVNGTEAIFESSSLTWSATVPLTEGMNTLDVALMNGASIEDSQNLIVNNAEVSFPEDTWVTQQNNRLSLIVGRSSIVHVDDSGAILDTALSVDDTALKEKGCIKIEQIWSNAFANELLLTCSGPDMDWDDVHFMLIDLISKEASFSRLLEHVSNPVILEDRYVVLITGASSLGSIGGEMRPEDQLTIIDLMTNQKHSITATYPENVFTYIYDFREYSNNLQLRLDYSIAVEDLLNAMLSGASTISVEKDVANFPEVSDSPATSDTNWLAADAIKVENAGADILVLEQSLLTYEEDSSQLVFRDLNDFSLISQYDLSDLLMEDRSSWAQVAHSAQREVMYKASHLHWWENHIWSSNTPIDTALVTEIDYKSGTEKILLDRLMVAELLTHDPETYFYINADLVVDETNQRLLLPVSTFAPLQGSDDGSIALLSYSLSNETWDVEFEIPKLSFNGEYSDASPYITNLSEDGGFAIVIYRDLNGTVLNCPAGCLSQQPMYHTLDHPASIAAFLSGSGDTLHYSSSIEGQAQSYELYSHPFGSSESSQITKWEDESGFWVESRGFSPSLKLFYGVVDGLLVVMDEESGDRIFPTLQ